MAGGAFHLGHFRRMRKILDRHMAIYAAKNSMDTRGVLLRANEDVFAFSRFHSGLAVAG
jgi:hypothetical protein